MDRVEYGGPGVLRLPAWTDELVAAQAVPEADEAAWMRLAIDLARANIERERGGPFGAAILAAGSGKLVAVGVNRVMANACALAHAEMVAIAHAQQRLGTHDLASCGRYVLVSTCEPCTMCLGATIWSGVVRLVCGAREEDARAIGFDEGPKPWDWAAQLEQRGIEVSENVERAAACDLFRRYRELGGEIYNARQSAGASEH